MPFFVRAIALILCLGLPWPPPTDAGSLKPTAAITVAVPADVLADYRDFMGGRRPRDIHDYSGPKSRRDVIELVLFQQALVLGGLNAGITFVVKPTYRRILEDLHDGRITASGTSIWKIDVENPYDNVYITEPVIRPGEFEAGFYTSPANHKALEANTLSRIQALTAVCNMNWTVDWKTLQALHPKKLTHIQNWLTMVRNVDHNRSDFLLAPFQPTPKMILEVEGMTLVPIQGIKIGLDGSRHFVVSRDAPDGNAVFEALQKGVAKLRAQKRIRKAYRQSGFFSEEAYCWNRVNMSLQSVRSLAE